MVNFTLASWFIAAQLWIVEEDAGKWNHLLRMVSAEDRRSILISYTGDAPLGKEGESIQVYLQDIRCDQVQKQGARTYDRAYPNGAWICTAEKAER